ncbi:hypothetical protein SCP_0607100 [Sparassis crispa]|uniref:Uncharacterized protein n=1 Tax=Sparassis crispa TaxID=139825 RepID=A0A401GRF2_9APHY|nr:hypothetical protein SCP_0607100 [Sparassis crispa]GBE84730.1 hypothetical protein SCP_0607100 [Sparassis crispa]
MWNVEMCYGPVIEVFEVEGSCECRLVIGYKMGGTSKFFSALSNLYHFYALYSMCKYIEQFSNGITIISLYLNPLPSALNAPTIKHSIFQVMKEASLLYCLPDNPFFYAEPGQNSGHAVQEATYAYCGWVFMQHFCNHLGPAYLALKNILDESNSSHMEVLNNIKHRFREETFMRESIAQVIHAHADLINLLPTLSYQRLQTQVPLSDEDLYDKIRKTVHNKHELQVLESFLIFNKCIQLPHVLKTNFYQLTKVALSFRLVPDFLPEVEYPKKPFGMFFIIGGEFRGFHIRFRDVVRGGIRIVMLRNSELGSSPRLCFEKYVDAVINLLIPGQSPRIKKCLIDLYGKPELLFFGPDEGTVDMMDWAALHTRARGAETWWKSFTMGKSTETLSGILHDQFGMTSLSIQQYVLGIYKQLGLREKDITKVQTGGPADGDLGSSDSDKTIAVIDSSGVLADPAGIDHEELI